MIKQEGGEWCLYTSDGSRKLGCHPSEQEAKAQEAAIKAREAAGREPLVRFELGEIDISGGGDILANGNVTKWIPLAEAGEKWINGPWEFDITPAAIEQAIKNFEARGKHPLPVTYGHVDDSGAPAQAWINDIELRADGRPWGLMEFLTPTLESIERGEYKFFSLEFYPESVDGHGNPIGFEIEGGAILNKPFFPGLRVDQAAARGRPCIRLSKFVNARPTDRGTARGAGGHMADDPKPAPAGKDPVKAEDVKIDGERVTLTRASFDRLMTLQRENEELKGKVGTLEAEKESTGARILRLEKARGADRIRAAVKDLQNDGVIVQLGDYVLKNDDEAHAWLTQGPWGVTTIEGLEKLSTDREFSAHLPRVKLGGERSGGVSRVAPVDLSTEAGRNEAVRRQEAELRKTYRPEELETQLRRRGGDITQLARELVAAENPTYRRQIMERK